MLNAMIHELRLQKATSFLPSGPVQSIYFGGGTPSVLEVAEIEQLLNETAKLYDCSQVQEITLEANPDDLTSSKINDLHRAGINRLSIGVQSFFDEDLQWMNRAHRGLEAEHALKNAQDAGFWNITADLIYGFPLLTDEKWHQNIGKMLAFGIPHISAYSMTVETRTALGSFVHKGIQPDMDEEQSARHFEMLMDKLEESGYDHYEISNWAKPSNQAVHNANYWSGVPYLGVGPSAHSFDGRKRQWNVRNNAIYVRELGEGKIPFESEVLTDKDRLNEYIMTSLRTAQGMDFDHVKTAFAGVAPIEEMERALNQLTAKGLIKEGGMMPNVIVLTRPGKMLADRIASDLFVE